MTWRPAAARARIETFEWPYAFRMPFRFGAITVTQGRQAVVRVRIALADGREAVGMAAEALAAKWFDKNPALTDDDNFEQLRSRAGKRVGRLSRARGGHGVRPLRRELCSR